MQSDTLEEFTRLQEQVDGLKRELRIELDWRDRALALQAKEYERRLETLNNEAGRIAKNNEAKVSIEKFDSLRDVVIDLVGRTTGTGATLTRLATALALLLSLLALIKGWK